MFHRRALFALVLAVGLVGCEASDIVEPSADPSFAVSGRGVVASATGSGSYKIGPGESRIFTFSASQGADGSASGQFTLTITEPVGGSTNPSILRLEAEVVCLAVEGNRAWVGGVVKNASNPAWIGRETGWAVEDNGAGSPSPDLISLVSNPAFTSPGFAQRVCDNRSRVPAFPIEGGNVRVSGGDGFIPGPEPTLIASGGGTVVTASGRSTYAFHASVDGAGSTKGQFEIHFSSVPWELHGTVRCLVVSGGVAQFGGIIERSNATNPDWQAGGEIIWSASDGGEGANAPADRVTSFFRHPASDCTAPTWNIKDWTHGNVQIIRPGDMGRGGPPSSVLPPDALCSENPADAIASFEDPALQTAVMEALGVASADQLTCGAISGLTFLDAGARGITSLVGAQNLTGLTFVTLWANAVTDLTPIGGLSGLTGLDLTDNPTGDVTALSGLTALEFLRLGGNGISDITPLAGLTGLIHLSLEGNGLTDISALSGLTGLEELNLFTNMFSDLSPLRELTSLRRLELFDNLNLSDVTPLLQNADLGGLGPGDYVSLWDTSVSCFDVLQLRLRGMTVDAGGC